MTQSVATIHCEHYRCQLSAAICVRRQLRRKRLAKTKELRPVYDWCGSGKCEQGQQVLASLNTKPAAEILVPDGRGGFSLPVVHKSGRVTRSSIECADGRRSQA